MKPDVEIVNSNTGFLLKRVQTRTENTAMLRGEVHSDRYGGN